MKEWIVHHSLSDLYASLGQPMEQDLDFTIHTLPDIKFEVPYQSPTYRAEYFSFVFVKSGSGWYTLDDQRFRTGPGTLYFTNPGHWKSFEVETRTDGYIITLTESFLRENVHPDIFEEFPFLLAETVPPTILSPEAMTEFEATYEHILREFQGNSPYRERILGNLFAVLLLKIKECSCLNYNPLEEGDRSSAIVQKFKRLVERNFAERSQGSSASGNQVQDYARELHLHPNYLSQVIKSKTGQPVHHWIAQRQLSTAKTLLRNTSLSAKEISFRLGFSEATHFSRFFRKHTGQSPGNYRKTVSS
ncbi:MAG: AraC family transcriptional regulator [Leptolyngbya sp. SIO3F4]|nr:AraC family transcriptional regulator [Leptolyngbya sp. SIO3F4]